MEKKGQRRSLTSSGKDKKLDSQTPSAPTMCQALGKVFWHFIWNPQHNPQAKYHLQVKELRFSRQSWDLNPSPPEPKDVHFLFYYGVSSKKDTGVWVRPWPQRWPTQKGSKSCPCRCPGSIL